MRETKSNQPTYSNPDKEPKALDIGPHPPTYGCPCRDGTCRECIQLNTHSYDIREQFVSAWQLNPNKEEREGGKTLIPVPCIDVNKVSYLEIRAEGPLVVWLYNGSFKTYPANSPTALYLLDRFKKGKTYNIKEYETDKGNRTVYTKHQSGGHNALSSRQGRDDPVSYGGVAAPAVTRDDDIRTTDGSGEQS